MQFDRYNSSLDIIGHLDLVVILDVVPELHEVNMDTVCDTDITVVSA